MTCVLETLYWLCLLAVVYPYLGYPLALKLLVALRGAWRPTIPADFSWPSVTMVVSAYNEAAVIAAKLENAVALDYPADRFEVLVVSDASDDGTDDIVRRMAAADPRITLSRQHERHGKTAGLNCALPQARGDVIVFSDANAMYRPDAIRELVAPLGDPRVGYVVGAQRYTDADAGESQNSEGLYWRYELAIKALESDFGSVVGGDGAIYAIRRELFWPLREDDINDFVNPMQIIAAGYRGVFNPRAECHEESADSFDKEFKRKRRIVNRSWRATTRYAGPLLRPRHAAFLFQLVSHKVVRWFAMLWLGLLAFVNLLLVVIAHSPFYVLSLAGFALSVALAVGARRQLRAGARPPRVAYLFYYFYLVNLAGLLGILDELRGIRHSKWDHVRNATNR